MTTQPVSSRARASSGSSSRLALGVDERLDRDVVARPRLRRSSSSSEPSRLDVGLAGREHLVRLVLRGLDVRLVERVDPEDRAGHRGRELPAVELLPELVRRRQPHLGRLAVRAVSGDSSGRRDQALAVLAGRLGEQLLGPEPEAARVRVDRRPCRGPRSSRCRARARARGRGCPPRRGRPRPSPRRAPAAARGRRPSARPERARRPTAPSSARRSSARRRRCRGSRAPRRAARAPSRDR